jgi:hypothetical protein
VYRSGSKKHAKVSHRPRINSSRSNQLREEAEKVNSSRSNRSQEKAESAVAEPNFLDSPDVAWQEPAVEQVITYLGNGMSLLKPMEPSFFGVLCD